MQRQLEELKQAQLPGELQASSPVRAAFGTAQRTTCADSALLPHPPSRILHPRTLAFCSPVWFRALVWSRIRAHPSVVQLS